MSTGMQSPTLQLRTGTLTLGTLWPRLLRAIYNVGGSVPGACWQPSQQEEGQPCSHKRGAHRDCLQNFLQHKFPMQRSSDSTHCGALWHLRGEHLCASDANMAKNGGRCAGARPQQAFREGSFWQGALATSAALDGVFSVSEEAGALCLPAFMTGLWV